LLLGGAPGHQHDHKLVQNVEGGACARDRGVKEGNRASPAAGAGRGRRGYSSELVEAPKCSKRRDVE
jgi:hypothetical protein